MSDTKNTPEELVYIGRRHSAKPGKIIYAYMSLRVEGLERYFAKPLALGQTVGAVVTIIHPEEGDMTRYYASGEFGPRVSGFSDLPEADIVRWGVEDRAVAQVVAERNSAKRAAARATTMQSHIDMLIFAARGLNFTERAAFARWVEDQIRSGS